ncbi:Signal recognition particle subunit SRP72 [Friedmanniomyces endolithicus]|nr:Signal recognition particle subunit SRP72 [Friedmanniomyces endolithicus]KAK0840523.1 Signal recognition particle subunit SRP72 [Friedmanniomyces endolithicus]
MPNPHISRSVLAENSTDTGTNSGSTSTNAPPSQAAPRSPMRTPARVRSPFREDGGYAAPPPPRSPGFATGGAIESIQEDSELDTSTLGHQDTLGPLPQVPAMASFSRSGSLRRRSASPLHSLTQAPTSTTSTNIHADNHTMYSSSATNSPSLGPQRFTESYPTLHHYGSTSSFASSVPSTPTSVRSRSRSPSISSLDTLDEAPDMESEALEADQLERLKLAAERQERMERGEDLGEEEGSQGGGVRRRSSLDTDGGARRSVGFGFARTSGGAGNRERKRWSICGGERRGDLDLETIWEDEGRASSDDSQWSIMSSSSSSSLPALTSLLQQAHIEDHDEILKAANTALKHSKGDLDAQHVKIVALLKLDRFDDAIHAFNGGGDKLKERARLEYAYTLYKTGNPSEAADVAQLGDDRGYKHIAAQASYRTEDFRRAAELYQHLAAQPEDDAEADLRINSGAVDAQLEWAGQGALVLKKKPGRQDLEAYETAYNAACGAIARGELGQGEVLLRRARDLCNALEDLGEEEKRAELLPIGVQQVYVLARQGRSVQAEEMAREVGFEGIADASTRHIAQVNKIAASGAAGNPFMAQRLMAKGLHASEPDHPFRFQTSILHQNKYAVDLRSLKFGGTAESTAEILTKRQSPNLDAYHNNVSVINAAAHAKARTGKEALKHILPLLERRQNDVGLILTIVQLYVLTGNSASAINLLETFFGRLEKLSNAAKAEIRFAPGLVSVMVSLYHNAGRRAPALRILANAAQHWRRRKAAERPSGVVHLLKAAGSALLDSPEPEHQHLATDIFSALHKEDERDRYAAAGFLAASPSSATQTSLTASLQPIDRLLSTLDTDALESAGIAQPTSTAAASTRKRPASDDQPSKPSKPKRIRTSRLPKDYDPSKTPDPERWLPLRDRSTYRPKGGKKGKVARQALLSQGSAPTAGGDSEGSRPGTPGGAGGEVVKGKVPLGKVGGKRKGKR